MRNMYGVLEKTMKKKERKHEKDARYSKYKLKIKQIPIHV